MDPPFAVRARRVFREYDRGSGRFAFCALNPGEIKMSRLEDLHSPSDGAIHVDGARGPALERTNMPIDPNDPVLPLGKSSVIVEIAGETQRFRVYTATLSRLGRRRIGLRFDGPQGSVTIELSLVTFWQITAIFHEQSIARQD
jgi:hypothetical protein